MCRYLFYMNAFTCLFRGTQSYTCTHCIHHIAYIVYLKVLLESQPEAAAVEDAAGRMALHVAVDKHQPWIRLVDTLVDAYPTACKMRDGIR